MHGYSGVHQELVRMLLVLPECTAALLRRWMDLKDTVGSAKTPCSQLNTRNLCES